MIVAENRNDKPCPDAPRNAYRRRQPISITRRGKIAWRPSPLLVCDPVLQKLGHADALLQALAEEGIEAAVFSDVVEDPTDISIATLVKRISDGGHDSLVALGGGSAMDTAKAGAIVATSGEDLRALKVPRIVDFAVMPVIAIPTTAGTGSEVTRAAVVTDTAASEKC